MLEFTLVSPHDATQISEANWNTNNPIPLNRGFKFTTAGKQQYTVTSADINGIFYACMLHLNGGKKGQVIVSEPTLWMGKTLFEEFQVYPNPTTGMITLGNDEPTQVKVYDQYVTVVKDVYIQSKRQIDLQI